VAGVAANHTAGLKDRQGRCVRAPDPAWRLFSGEYSAGWRPGWVAGDCFRFRAHTARGPPPERPPRRRVRLLAEAIRRGVHAHQPDANPLDHPAEPPYATSPRSNIVINNAVRLDLQVIPRFLPTRLIRKAASSATLSQRQANQAPRCYGRCASGRSLHIAHFNRANEQDAQEPRVQIGSPGLDRFPGGDQDGHNGGLWANKRARSARERTISLR
jgi:hypothetical protein